MAKDVKFNIKLTIDGKEHIVEAATDVKRLSQELGIAETAENTQRAAAVQKRLWPNRLVIHSFLKSFFSRKESRIIEQ